MSDEITDTESASARAFDYDRTVALSDGVFAIALTLLVLTIGFPELHGTDRRARLVVSLRGRADRVSRSAILDRAVRQPDVLAE